MEGLINYNSGEESDPLEVEVKMDAYNDLRDF